MALRVLRALSAIAMIWPYILLPLGNATSCEQAVGQISKEIKELTLGFRQISTHLADLVQDIHCMRHKNKDVDNFPVTDCMAHQSAGQVKDGVYTIVPDGKIPKLVYCDMTTDGGGWTVFQRRVDDSVNFYRGYQEYQQGFGDPQGNIWLGLDMIHVLSEPTTELFVDMIANDTHKAFAKYDSIMVANETDGYRLSVSGYSGTAGDSLTYHDGQTFSTYDRDEDTSSDNCAKKRKGAWWYKGCLHSNLNGLYLNRSHESVADGINWRTFSGYYYSLKQVEMKIRRKI